MANLIIEFQDEETLDMFCYWWSELAGGEESFKDYVKQQEDIDIEVVSSRLPEFLSISHQE